MHNIKLILVLILIFLLINGCSTPAGLDYSSELIGTWVHHDESDETSLLKRSKKLADNKYGFIIKGNGSFIERKNSGWCGTPPISYANFKGTWKEESDSTLKIETGFWDGTVKYRIEIVSIFKNVLTIKYSDFEYISVQP